jgi:hypothetical protein
MSDQEQKDKRSKRLHKEQAAIDKQLKIAKAHGMDTRELEREPHRLAKHHTMDCGQTGCVLCGNRRAIEGVTKQEKSFKQTEMWME